jgi:outer membrane protein OmpA-like peptidoglycan-associated protein
MKKLIKLLVIFCFSYSLAISQTEDIKTNKVYVGLFGALAYNMHTGTLGIKDGLTNCGYFSDANSLRWAIGNMIEFPLFSDIWLSNRITYHFAGADFSTLNPIQPNVSLSDGSLVRQVTQQNLETSIEYLNLSVLAKYYLLDGLYGCFGPVIGINTNAAFNQTEDIISPKGLTYISGETSRLIVSGEFGKSGTEQTKQLRIAAQLGIGYDYKLNDRFVLNPEISYQYSFANVFTPSDWKISSLFAGIGLKVLIGTKETTIKPENIIKEEPVKEPIKKDTIIASDIKPQPIIPIASIEAKNLLQDKTQLNYAEISVSDEISNFVLPLLPYIFFETDQSKLSQRYQLLNEDNTKDFSESKFRNAMDVYYNLLNIVGSRLIKYPESRITITGCVEPDDDKNNLQALSLARANVLKEYLVKVWKISEKRIDVTSRSLPAVISNRQDIDGREENRRAEFSSDDQRILAPIRGNFVNPTVTPESIVFLPKVTNPDYVKNWKLNVDNDNNEIFSQNGNDKPLDRIVWNYDKEELAKIIRRNNQFHSLLAKYNIVGKGDEESTSYASIPVKYNVTSKLLDGKLINDTIVERYYLIFFDFDTPKISKFNESVVSLIHSRIRTNSTVKVLGYTDRIGSKDRNIELSRKRANAMADAIRERIVPDNILTEGKGPTPLYDNNFPEGRMYNRTVVVEIYTPVEKTY